MISFRPLAALVFAATTLLAAGCAQMRTVPVVVDGHSVKPTLTPLMLDGRCALIVSGSAQGSGKAIGRVDLNVEEGVAQVDVVLAPLDANSATTFHVVVPIDELHVAVIFVGQPRYPIWERAAGGKGC